jgi:hypothetical protein
MFNKKRPDCWYVLLSVLLIVLVIVSMSCSISEKTGSDSDSDSDDHDDKDDAQPDSECDQNEDINDLPARIRVSSDGLRLVTGLGFPKDFYDFSVIRTIRLAFSQSNWWTQLTNNYQSETEIPAQLSYDGTTLASSVGVRFKGATSYMQNRTEKKSFNISLDYEDADQNIEGFNDLNLNCAFGDDTFMREVVYEHINQIYVPAVAVNYVELYINNVYWGIYINSQQIDKNFYKAWFPSTNGTGWRAKSPTGGLGGFGTGKSGLNYLGTTSASYTPYYTLKKYCVSDPWASLIDVCAVLANTTTAEMEEAVSKVLDLDRTLWFLALENVFTDEDSYIHKGGEDYYLYWDITSGLMTPIEYDGNSVLLQQYSSWSPFRNANNSAFPLLNKLLNAPGIRQRYLAHIRTILRESFNLSNLANMIDAYASKISPYVSADPKKMMSYTAFQSAVSTLKSLVNTRYNNLMANSEINVSDLTVTDVQWKVGGSPWAAPSSSDAVTINAAVAGGMGVSGVYAYVGGGVVGPFTKYALLDDGRNGDGGAGDGVYGVILQPRNSGARVRFYVEAVASDSAGTRTYYPSGAAHDVFTWVVR